MEREREDRKTRMASNVIGISETSLRKGTERLNRNGELDALVLSLEDAEKGAQYSSVIDSLLAVPPESYTALVSAWKALKEKLAQKSEADFFNKTYVLEFFAKLSMKISSRDMKRYPQLLQMYKTFFGFWLADAQTEKPFRFHAKMKPAKKSWIALLLCRCLQFVPVTSLVPDVYQVMSYPKILQIFVKFLRSLYEDGKQDDERLLSLTLHGLDCLISSRQIQNEEVESEIEQYLINILLTSSNEKHISFARAALFSYLKVNIHKLNTFATAALIGSQASWAKGMILDHVEALRKEYFRAFCTVVQEDRKVRGCNLHPQTSHHHRIH